MIDQQLLGEEGIAPMANCLHIQNSFTFKPDYLGIRESNYVQLYVKKKTDKGKQLTTLRPTHLFTLQKNP